MCRHRLLGLLVVAMLLPHSPARAGGVTMDQLWPNQDGRAWQYDQLYRTFGLVPQVVSNRIRLLLDGVTVAPTAIDAQYLRQELVSGPAAANLLASQVRDPFLRGLWLARPDLRASIEATLDGQSCPTTAPSGAYSILLTGESAFLKTASEFANWRCNLADTRAWLWLESNLTIGSTFSLQLVPDLAANVFLHGTVGAVEAVTVPAATYPSCVRIDYAVDYGSVDCEDGDGNILGSSRAETRGYVHYAPDVGPVNSFEEFIPIAEFTGTCAEPGDLDQPLSRTTLRLASPSVPALPVSWGRIKTRYR